MREKIQELKRFTACNSNYDSSTPNTIAPRYINAEAAVMSSSSPRAQFFKQFLKQSPLIALAVVFVYLFADSLEQMQFSNIWAALRRVSFLQWAGALIATVISFWAVGRYDAVIHRHIGTSIPNLVASRAGIAAIAVSQTTGFGLFTGALARWRLLPELNLLQCTKISASVAVSFLAGLAVVLSITSWVIGIPVYGLNGENTWVNLAVLLPLLGGAALVLTSLFQPQIAIRGHALRWPSVSAVFAITGFVAADTLAAGTALFVLLPPELNLSFGLVYPAFLAAFAVALISGTPGGVGPFEVTLMLALPMVPNEPLFATILAFRIIYYALPALLGAIVLAHGIKRSSTQKLVMRDIKGGTGWLTAGLEARIHQAPRAEANLLRQDNKILLFAPQNNLGIIASQKGQCLIGLGDPIGATSSQHDLQGVPSDFKCTARARNLLPLLYKIGGRMAIAASQSGMCVLPICKEAWLKPSEFDLSQPSRRQLRRKLRKATKAGVSIKSLEQHENLHDTLTKMGDIADHWARRHGGERGFSMGTYDPQFVQTQRCFLAYHAGSLVGFATFSTVAREWTLDLMRYGDTCPDGTMHTLVVEAIARASQEDIPRVSLASVPWTPPDSSNRATRRVWKIFAQRSGGVGLYQFKTSFAPHWETLYMAAPNRWALLLGTFDVIRAVNSRVKLKSRSGIAQRLRSWCNYPPHERPSQRL